MRLWQDHWVLFFWRPPLSFILLSLFTSPSMHSSPHLILSDCVLGLPGPFSYSLSHIHTTSVLRMFYFLDYTDKKNCTGRQIPLSGSSTQLDSWPLLFRAENESLKPELNNIQFPLRLCFLKPSCNFLALCLLSKFFSLMLLFCFEETCIQLEFLLPKHSLSELGLAQNEKGTPTELRICCTNLITVFL